MCKEKQCDGWKPNTEKHSGTNTPTGLSSHTQQAVTWQRRPDINPTDPPLPLPVRSRVCERVCVFVHTNTKQQKRRSEYKNRERLEAKRQKGVTLYWSVTLHLPEFKLEISWSTGSDKRPCTLCVIIANAHLHFHLKRTPRLIATPL